MKLSEAPRAGWYPDPEGGTRLRWWDGGDWIDRYRLRPQLLLEAQPVAPPVGYVPPGNRAPDVSQFGNPAQFQAQTAAVVEQVRQAARAEAQRAAQDFEARARALTGEIPPLVSEYTNKFMRWFRVALMLSFIIIVAWFIYTFFVQKSFWDWLGDRIDHATNSGNGEGLPVDPREAVIVVLSH
jgi:hypothetical protein